MEKERWGTTKDGKEILLYTLSNRNGMTVRLTNVGASIVSIIVPDRSGEMRDVVLGFDRGEDYLSNDAFMGAVVAPSANRIAGASFTIGNKKFRLEQNENENNLHGSFENGSHLKLWASEGIGQSVAFSLKMKDGELGFPGDREMSVTYTLTDDNALTLSYHGVSDQKTLFNPTNHVYFNLSGHESGKILPTQLIIHANAFTEIRAGGIPTGRLLQVKDTVMDFMTPHSIGARIDQDYEQLELTGGYDHNYVISDRASDLKEIARAHDPRSGIEMTVLTTLPGVQFYAGNWIGKKTGKGGTIYEDRHGFCLETQFFPNAINQDGFASPVFGEKEDYRSETIYRFGVK